MNYRPGDKVLIKSWEKLVAEYGTDAEGDILCGGDAVVTRMKPYCGTIMTVSQCLRFSEEYTMIEDEGRWWYNEEMIECAIK